MRCNRASSCGPNFVFVFDFFVLFGLGSGCVSCDVDCGFERTSASTSGVFFLVVIFAVIFELEFVGEPRPLRGTSCVIPVFANPSPNFYGLPAVGFASLSFFAIPAVIVIVIAIVIATGCCAAVWMVFVVVAVVGRSAVAGHSQTKQRVGSDGGWSSASETREFLVGASAVFLSSAAAPF